MGQRHHEVAGIAVVPGAVEVHLRIVFLVEQIVDVELQGGLLRERIARHQIGDRVAGEVRAALHERAAAIRTPHRCPRTALPPHAAAYRQVPQSAGKGACRKQVEGIPRQGGIQFCVSRRNGVSVFLRVISAIKSARAILKKFVVNITC